MDAIAQDQNYSSQQLFDDYAAHVNPTLVKLLRVLGYGRAYTRANDVWVWDANGRRYLDLLAGFGAVNIGHNHPRVKHKMIEYLQRDALQLNHIAPSQQQAELAGALADALPEPLKLTLFSSSGAEAVEAAMKLARAATGRKGFVYCENAYHGTSLGTLGIMGKARMRDPFAPLLGHCQAVAFNDLDQMQAALRAKTVAAVIIEPIQGEGGVVLPEPGYLSGVAELCRRYGTLLVADEIQTGLGRSGALFAFSVENFVPDILVLGKSLCGGFTAISATVTSPKIFKKAYGKLDRFDLHSSTFGGNGLACVVAKETLDLLQDQKLPESSEKRGRELLLGLRQQLLGHALVREIRGRGLMVGIELGPGDSGWLNKTVPALVRFAARNAVGQWLAVKLLESGIICQPAAHQWNVLKLTPALTITSGEINAAISTIVKVFNTYENLGFLIRDLSARLLQRDKSALMY